MVVRHGRVTDTSQPDLAALLRDILQQQTAMLQVQAESVRLQRVLVERLLGVSDPQDDSTVAGSIAPTDARDLTLTDLPMANASSGVPVPTLCAASEPPPGEAIFEQTPGSSPEKTESDLSFTPAPVEHNPVRSARYYQPRASPTARSIAPDELELLRRMQEMRESSDLILQFGPHKGATLAQVAMSNPEYIRQLMTKAKRPEVRAAAGRLVRALDAAAEHKPKTRGLTRRGRSPGSPENQRPVSYD
jgi:hypothetical protein